MMPAPTVLSSPLESPKNSLSLRFSTWSALPKYGVSIPSCSLATAGSSLVALAPDNVVAAANSLLTRVSSALTTSSPVVMDAFYSSNATMVASRSRLSLAQLIRLLSFSLCRAAT